MDNRPFPSLMVLVLVLLAFVVFGLFLQYLAERLAEKNVSEMIRSVNMPDCAVRGSKFESHGR